MTDTASAEHFAITVSTSSLNAERFKWACVSTYFILPFYHTLL